MRWCLLSVFLIAVSCAAPLPSRNSASTAPASPLIHVRVSPLQGGDWRVDYELPAALTTTSFARPSFAHRITDWHMIVPSDAQLVRTVDGDVISAPTAFTHVALRVSNPTKPVEKDYALTFTFTDGSVLLYTGHFDLKEGPSLFTFVGREGDRVIVPSGTFAGAATWTANDDTTYVYLGKLQPVVEPQYTLAVDPGFPPWLREHLLTLIPRLIAYYGKQLGRPLPWRPSIFLSYAEDAREGSMSFTGNTQTGLVQMEISLGPSSRQVGNSEVKKKASVVLAHEIAHLWNAHVYENVGSDWLHEGGAETFAWRAIRAAEVISQSEYERELSLAVSWCLFGLDDKPLLESSKSGRFKNYYTCGATISLWAESALGLAEPGVDAFTLWRAVFAASSENKYDGETFTKMLTSMGASATLRTDVNTFVTQPLASPAWLIEHLKKAGLTITDKPDTATLPHEYRQLAKERALAVLSKSACSEGGQVQLDKQHGLTFTPDKCPALPPATDFASISGVRLAAPIDTVALYDALVSSCSARRQIVVKTVSMSVSLPCVGPVRPRPPYLEIGGAAAPPPFAAKQL